MGGIGRYVGSLVALLVVTIWGVNFVMLKAALAQWDPLAFTFVRFLIMLALSLGVLWWSGQGGSAPLERSELGRVALAGLLGFTLYMLLSVVGIDRTTAFSNALLLAIAPLFTALFLSSLGAEAVSSRQWLAMLIAFGGVVLFLAEKAGDSINSASIGDLLCLAAAACFAAYAVVNRPLLARHSATRVTAWALALGSLPVLLVTAPAVTRQDWSRVSADGWLLLVWAATIPTYVCWSLWSWVNHRAGVGRSAMFLFLTPIVSGITSWLLLGERFGALKLGGALLTLGGLFLAQRATHQRQGSPAPSKGLAVKAIPRRSGAPQHGQR